MLLPKIWFVIEASKGLGLLLVRQLLSPGYVVAATSRYTDELKNAVQPTGPDHFLRLQEDLGGEATVRHALETTVQNFGGLDVVVNNAGYG